MMKIGSKWYGSNGDLFEVDDIRVINGETWVFYTNTFTMKMFNCLLDHFKEKFRKYDNGQ